MPVVVRKSRKSSKGRRESLIRRMETAGPTGEKLRRLVRKHPAPQQWYDEDAAEAKTPKLKR
jgi:hypothetical protein